MVHLLTGRCGTGKSTAVAEAMVREITEGSRPVVLLVPEQQTVAWETRMASLLPASANFRLEITNFTRLANSVFRFCGGLSDPVVDAGTRSLLIWQAMQTVWEQLTVYNACTAGREDRNIPHLTEAVDELKNSGISPAQAEEALAQLLREEEAAPDAGKNGKNTRRGNLPSRLSDAVHVYAAYNALLHEQYIDRGDLLDNLAKTLEKHPYFRGKAVFVDSFFSLTTAEERILSRIMQQAEEVTVTFTCPPRRSRLAEQAEQAEEAEEERPEIQFQEVRQYLRTAASLAARAGQRVAYVALTENHRHSKAPDLALLEQELFRYGAPGDVPGDVPGGETDENERKNEHTEEKQPEAVEIIPCADVYDEAEACAAMVDRLLAEGYRCSEIAVVARDMKSREGIVDAVLRRHGVRCFLSETSDVSNLPAVRFVLAALAVAANGWDRRDVMALLKTGLTGVGRPAPENPAPEHPAEESAAEKVPAEESAAEKVPAEESVAEKVPADESAAEESAEKTPAGYSPALEGDLLELYTETWNIRGRKMFTSGPWPMNPAGYTTERTERGEEMLRLVNDAREKLVGPLEKLTAVFDGGAASVRAIAEKIVEYAEECQLGRSLREAAKVYRLMGLPADAEKTLGSWNRVCDILDCMVGTLGDSRLDAGRFAGLFRQVAASMDAGTIPTGTDEVVLGSASGVRFDEVRCVLVLGAADGEFPGTAQDSGTFFSDRDKAQLAAVGLQLGSPGLDIQTAREYFMFYRVTAAASERLFLFAPVPDTARLSDGAQRIRTILEKKGRHPLHKFASMPLSEVVFHRETAEYLLCRRTDPAEIAVLEALLARPVPEKGTLPAEKSDTAGQTAQISMDGLVHSVLLSGQSIQKNARKTSRLTLTQSKIETFVQCPFQYWCKYEMNVHPTPAAEIKSPDIGTFLHAVLEKFFAGLTPEQLRHLPLPVQETEKMADAIMETYLRRLAQAGLGQAGDDGVTLDGRLSYLFLRLRRHVLLFLRALMEELAQSGFVPVAYELPIGLGNAGKNGQKSVPPLVLHAEDGTEVVLRGIADRVDVYEAPDGQKYVRIVDYKTGSKTFAIDDVRRGLHVQMLIYLFSVCRFGLPLDKDTSYLPGGAVYFQAKPASVSYGTMPGREEAEGAAMKKIERSGVLLEEEGVLRAMDAQLDGTYAKAKFDARGNLKSMQKSTTLLSLEGFGELYREMQDVLEHIASAMLRGEARAKPLQMNGTLPCTWCAYRAICRIVQE